VANDSIDRVTVLGAGVLGGQIAWHSAFKGKRVVLYDPFPDALQRAAAAQQMYERIYRGQLGARDADIEATRARLTATGDLAAAVADADLVIEAVPEVPEVKADVYRAIAPLLPPRTIVATNSSTLLPRDFADLTGRPAQFCALHFANLIWALNVAEVMAHAGTSPATLAAVTRFAIEIGQVPIAVQKERNGYVLNAWLKPLLTASLSVVVDGVATAEDVDRTFMIVNRGCTMGPFGTIDVIGMKTVHDVSAYWATVTGDARMQRNADYIKENFLDRGLQGMLGGQGFYTYPDPAYAAPDFLAVPGLAAVPELVARMLPK
jgi:3-hydroxyacyl-CoA dehydrogenase